MGVSETTRGSRTTVGSGRVVVTGYGVISSIGNGRRGYLEGLLAGRNGAVPVTAFDAAGFEYGRVCEVRDFAVDEDRPQLGRATQMTLAVTRAALADAGLTPSDLRAARGLVAIGTTDGEARDVDDLAATEVHKGLAEIDPVVARRVRPGLMSMAVADDLGLSDVEVITLPDVCAAGNYAIGYGLDAVRSGEAEYALVGGADAPSRKTFASFYRLRSLAEEVCQPFDRDRGGVVLGEGAATLVLEPLEAALARGATIHAEVLDYHLNCDAAHPTRPQPETVAECLRGALRRSGVAPREVDLVIPHATGTRTNDAMEAVALADVFGDVPVPPLSGIKSMIGHTMGAAGVHSAVAAILAMRYGFLPPTINHRTPDPECPVDCVPNAARPAEPRTVLVNALGFGGVNAAVVLRRHDDESARVTS